MESEDDLSLYAYVGNDPLDRFDPTGTKSETAQNGASCQFDEFKDNKGNTISREQATLAPFEQTFGHEELHAAYMWIGSAKGWDTPGDEYQTAHQKSFNDASDAIQQERLARASCHSDRHNVGTGRSTFRLLY